MPNNDPPRDFADWIGLSQPPNWTKSRRLGSLIGIVLVLFTTFLVGAAGWLIVASLQASASATPGATLGAGGLIVALLGAPFLIWNTIIKQKALGFQKEGHITDRISKAVEQLGAEKTIKRQRVSEAGNRVYEKGDDGKPDFSKPVAEEVTLPSIEVRIGGILSLERVAQDSCSYDGGRDHVRVMEILCAYVRENSPALHLTPTEPPFTHKTPRLDIQMAVDVIKRRSSVQKSVETSLKYRLNLRDVDLDGVDLSKGDFAGAIFWQSRFEAANLCRANLTGTQMQGSLLNYADWNDAKILGTSLDQCVLNRPIPVAGGMNFRSPIFAEVKGMTVISADLSAMDYFGENSSVIIGSKDTVLSWQMNEMRNEAARIFPERQSAEYRNNAAKIAELDAQLTENPFKHWLPYDGSDLAVGHYRAKHFEAWGLVDWPFRD